MPAVESAARVFLEAGAESVLATLRPVTDRTTRSLMSDFYRALDAGMAPAAALREAQLLRSRSDDPDSMEWSTFVLIAGRVSDEEQW